MTFYQLNLTLKKKKILFTLFSFPEKKSALFPTELVHHFFFYSAFFFYFVFPIKTRNKEPLGPLIPWGGTANNVGCSAWRPRGLRLGDTFSAKFCRRCSAFGPGVFDLGVQSVPFPCKASSPPMLCVQSIGGGFTYSLRAQHGGKSEAREKVSLTVQLLALGSSTSGLPFQQSFAETVQLLRLQSKSLCCFATKGHPACFATKETCFATPAQGDFPIASQSKGHPVCFATKRPSQRNFVGCSAFGGALTIIRDIPYTKRHTGVPGSTKKQKQLQVLLFSYKKKQHYTNFPNNKLNYWRTSPKIFSGIINTEKEKTQKAKNTVEYSLETFHRSNQDTCLLHYPTVFEGDWIQSGDLLADCAASSGGELALGKNILIAYMPWEGYNYEDSILISERLVYEDVYSSIHIEKYDVEIRQTKFGMESITRDIPELNRSHPHMNGVEKYLDHNGVVKLGSWIEEGDILVGRVTPINKKTQSTYKNLLYTILERKTQLVRDSSLRAPKGIKAKVINVQIYRQSYILQSNFRISSSSFNGIKKKKDSSFSSFPYLKGTCFVSEGKRKAKRKQLLRKPYKVKDAFCPLVPPFFLRSRFIATQALWGKKRTAFMPLPFWGCEAKKRYPSQSLRSKEGGYRFFPTSPLRFSRKKNFRREKKKKRVEKKKNYYKTRNWTFVLFNKIITLRKFFLHKTIKKEKKKKIKLCWYPLPEHILLKKLFFFFPFRAKQEGGVPFPFPFGEGKEATFFSSKKKHKPEQLSCTPPPFGWGAKPFVGGTRKERKGRTFFLYPLVPCTLTGYREKVREANQQLRTGKKKLFFFAFRPLGEKVQLSLAKLSYSVGVFFLFFLYGKKSNSRIAKLSFASLYFFARRAKNEREKKNKDYNPESQIPVASSLASQKKIKAEQPTKSLFLQSFLPLDKVQGKDAGRVSPSFALQNKGRREKQSKGKGWTAASQAPFRGEQDLWGTRKKKQATISFPKFYSKNKRTKSKITMVCIYLAERRKIQVGDKMSGRHGNKGIVSQILPKEDMPFLTNGTPLDMVLNPLGVPSRMNVGQIYECLLGLAAKFLGEHYKVFPFDEIYGPEASRSFVYSKLYEAKKKTGNEWLFNPNYPGKTRLFDGRTGNPFDQLVTVGFSYMFKLVHLVDDKIHCLTPDHDVLTTRGWIPISDVSLSHQVATLNNEGQLIYQNPNKIFNYLNYKGSLYYIKNANIDLKVTLNHRMYVKKGKIPGQNFNNYQLIEAQNLIGKHVKYLKNANWQKEPYQFILPSIVSNSIVIPSVEVDMDAWLTFFGLWIAEGWAVTNIIKEKESIISFNSNLKNENKNTIILDTPIELETQLELGTLTEKVKTKAVYQVQIACSKPRAIAILETIITKLGYNFHIIDNKYTIFNKQLYSYLRPLSLGASNKALPSWVWNLDKNQAQTLFYGLFLGHGTLRNNSVNYYTTSIQLADDVMRLALHAGWSGNKYLHLKKGHVVTIEGKNVMANSDLFRISIIKKKNNPAINHGHHKEQKCQVEKIIPYEGPVYCLSIPNQVFYVRRNGIPVWTGNSRSTGPYSLVTQQPLRGRSKQGGQRLGEMEVWALEGYGAAFTLLEMLTIKSDDMTGRMKLWSNLILNKDISIGTPESFKVLICELQALCLDIGIFRLNSKGNLLQIENLLELP